MMEPEVISHWYQLIDGLQCSTSDFYAKLREELKSWEIPRARMRDVEHSETGGMFGAKRLYFRVERDEYVFDICFSKFGRGCFVSWWLVTNPGCLTSLSAIPGVGLIIQRFIKDLTYYRVDTQLMFRDVVHACVLKLVDDLIKVNNLKELTVEERKPIMKEFFKR